MPTVRRCCIVGCLSNSRQNQQLQFFQFPKLENPFHKLWKQACHASLSRIMPFKKPVVCALHFHPTCVGGRRLTASAVPSLLLEVPSNLKAAEQKAIVEEIERSRKFAYINAVVYEWLVRANLNPQLRGSITHGMIKEKADTAKQLVDCSEFVADNRWLNRFRDTHLMGFAQKLTANQLKPLGPSLWIPDIVGDLQHLFPPTSADRVAKLENMPDQYIDYMTQYAPAEYEDEEEEEDDTDTSSSHQDQSSYPEQQQQQPLQGKHEHQEQQEQQQQSQYQQQQQMVTNTNGMYEPYSQQQPNYNYDDFYYERQNQQNAYGSQQQQLQQQQQQLQQQQQQQQQQQRLQSDFPPQQQQSTPIRVGTFLSSANPLKRPRETAQDESLQNGGSNGAKSEQIEDLTDGPDDHEISLNKNNNNRNDSRPTPVNGFITPNSSFAVASPKPVSNGGALTNGHTSPTNTTTAPKELETYAQALEYLKPLEDFALFKENFRAIGLISQLEVILRKGERVAASKTEQ